jgi:chromosome segregation ATPase
MSTENEENNIKQNNNIYYANLDKNELVKQNALVKDLVVKLDVLKKGVVDERKKTALLISKIKQLEEELNNKNNEIKKLSQEKLNPEEQTSSNNNNDTSKKVEDKKSEMALILAKEEIRKLNEQIINLQLEQENRNNKMKKTNEETEDLKKEYQVQIKLLSEANDSIIKELKNLKNENKTLEKKLDEEKKRAENIINSVPIQELMRDKEILIREKDKLLLEKEHFEALIADYKKSKDEAMGQLDACLKKNGELVLENQTYKDSIYTHEVNSGKMAQKLAEYKNIILNMSLRNQVFHVKKVGLISQNEMDIIFGKDKNGNYVMRIDEKNNSEMIDILDVESVNQNEKKKNRIDISYMYKSKKYHISVLVNELIVDQFLDAYKNYYSESIKRQK